MPAEILNRTGIDVKIHLKVIGEGALDKNGYRTIVGLSLLLLLGLVTYGMLKDYVVVISRFDVDAAKQQFLALGWYAPVISFLLMVIQAVVAPIPAFTLTMVNGVLFGPIWGGVLSLSSACVGAVVCFELSRSFGHGLLQRVLSRPSLEWVQQYTHQWGLTAILVARLIPVLPFDPLSYAAGLTGVRRIDFLWANVLGQMPATFLYSYMGHKMQTRFPYEWVGVILLGWFFGIVLQRRLQAKEK